MSSHSAASLFLVHSRRDPVFVLGDLDDGGRAPRRERSRRGRFHRCGRCGARSARTRRWRRAAVRPGGRTAPSRCCCSPRTPTVTRALRVDDDQRVLVHLGGQLDERVPHASPLVDCTAIGQEVRHPSSAGRHATAPRRGRAAWRRGRPRRRGSNAGALLRPGTPCHDWPVADATRPGRARLNDLPQPGLPTIQTRVSRKRMFVPMIGCGSGMPSRPALSSSALRSRSSGVGPSSSASRGSYGLVLMPATRRSRRGSRACSGTRSSARGRGRRRRRPSRRARRRAPRTPGSRSGPAVGPG